MSAKGGWRRARYSDLMAEGDERAGGRIEMPVLSVTKNRGLMLASERFGKVMHGRELSRYRVARRGQIVADPMLLWDGTIGVQNVVDAGLVSPDYRVYSPSTVVAPEFLAYLVRSPTVLPHYQGGARGTNVRRNRIARADFLAIPVDLPPLPEQHKIAAILSSVDESIRATHAVVAQLQVVKEATVAQLFTKGLPGRHTRFKETEVGSVPDEWEVLQLGELATRICVGIVVKPASYYVEMGVPCLRSKNVRPDRLELDDIVYISPSSNEQLAKSQLRAGDVVTVRTGDPGTSCVIPSDFAGINCIDLIITTPGPKLSGAFLSRFLNSAAAGQIVAAGKNGLAQQHFNVGALREMPVPVPSAEEQSKIVDALTIVDARKEAEAKVLAELRALKGVLMSALLTGDLRVRPDTPDEAAA